MISIKISLKKVLKSNSLTELNFSQIVSQSIHVTGGLSQFFSSLIKSVHYSDHGAVFVLTYALSLWYQM